MSPPQFGGDSPGGEKRVAQILAKIAGFTRKIESDDELIGLARQGDLMPYDPVWHPKMARWAHAQEIDFLLPAFQEARARFEKRMEEAEARAKSRGFLGRLLDRLLRR
ncbi:MAG TPA: hypothetical protein VMV18_03895 [bacterium]|nr:hypothetical protein [bacterium]